ncbi:MAG: polysaccharide export protein [Alphaproteobacteria bacterium]|nr:polysaccharide export protein [Alphaproteobacteria bacterium]
MRRPLLCCLLLAVLGLSFAPALAQDKEPVFHIRPGDVLQISVWKEEGMDRELVVLSDGTVTFPLAGTVAVAGQTIAQAQQLIKKRLKSAIPDATVTIMVRSPAGHKVSVLGQVARPGDVIITGNMTVMQALSNVGGLTPYASEGKIIILREVDGKKTSINYPYKAIAAGRKLDEDLRLLPGDVIVVPTSGIF